MLSSTTSTVPISSQSPLAAHNSSSRARVGLIVGGVLGGVALLLGATLLVVMLKRRENRRKYLLLQDAHLLGESVLLF